MSRHILLPCLGTAFGLAELALSLRKRSHADAARADRGSRHVLWIVIVSAWALASILAADVMLGRFRVRTALVRHPVPRTPVHGGRRDCARSSTHRPWSVSMDSSPLLCRRPARLS